MPYHADDVLIFESVDALKAAAEHQALFNQPHLVLGEGSNAVFTADFAGNIIKLNNHTIEVDEDDDFYYLSVDAGVIWHELVQWTLSQGYYGLENLALIPGTVGAAPIQNIGAYGVEFADVCDYVCYLDKQTLALQRLDKSQLALGYRDSIFKRQLRHQTVIYNVGFKLAKQWRATVNYAGLSDLSSADDIFTQVIALRQSKLPCHRQIPNAGSFFKNPLISHLQLNLLKQTFQHLPYYEVDPQLVKIPAAWLIEQCQLKGYSKDGVGVYAQHALVLVNTGHGTGAALLALIEHVQQTVVDKFAIELELEVQLIAQGGVDE